MIPLLFIFPDVNVFLLVYVALVFTIILCQDEKGFFFF